MVKLSVPLSCLLNCLFEFSAISLIRFNPRNSVASSKTPYSPHPKENPPAPHSKAIYLLINHSRRWLARNPARRTILADVIAQLSKAKLVVCSMRNWSLCAADSLSYRDRYPIKFDNRFTLVTRVVEYTRGQMQQADGFGVMLNVEFMYMLHLTTSFWLV